MPSAIQKLAEVKRFYYNLLATGISIMDANRQIAYSNGGPFVSYATVSETEEPVWSVGEYRIPGQTQTAHPGGTIEGAVLDFDDVPGNKPLYYPTLGEGGAPDSVQIFRDDPLAVRYQIAGLLFENKKDAEDAAAVIFVRG